MSRAMLPDMQGSESSLGSPSQRLILFGVTPGASEHSKEENHLSKGCFRNGITLFLSLNSSNPNCQASTLTPHAGKWSNPNRQANTRTPHAGKWGFCGRK